MVAELARRITAFRAVIEPEWAADRRCVVHPGEFGSEAPRRWLNGTAGDGLSAVNTSEALVWHRHDDAGQIANAVHTVLVAPMWPLLSVTPRLRIRVELQLELISSPAGATDPDAGLTHDAVSGPVNDLSAASGCQATSSASPSRQWREAQPRRAPLSAQGCHDREGGEDREKPRDSLSAYRLSNFLTQNCLPLQSIGAGLAVGCWPLAVGGPFG
ncbi:MAG: hypothetical protein M5U18_14370 [Dehalococcoidia bacterium]|nr:hypothetical protein [Dehalococcoidia bacterium]